MRWQMWGQRQSPNQWYLLDVKAVLPISETLSVTSLDSVNNQLTRVGKTYSVFINIIGLPTPSSGGTEDGQIYLGLSALVDGSTYGFRSLANYANLTTPPVTSTQAFNPLSEDQSNAWFLVNGSTNIANLAPNQPGQEIWVIDWIKTTEANSAVIDQGTMQVLAAPSILVNQPILPLYTGDTSSLPTLDLSFNNLFPGSLTILQILDNLQNPVATLTVNDNRPNASGTTTHSVAHFLLPLANDLPGPGTYTLQAWTAEPFSDGLPTISGIATPNNYTWSPLPIPGNTTFTVQFTARVNGTIITN